MTNQKVTETTEWYAEFSGILVFVLGIVFGFVIGVML